MRLRRSYSGRCLLAQVHWQPAPYNLSAIKATAFHLDIPGALHIGVFEIVFVFLFVDLFDNIGTLVAVTQRAGLIAPDHTIPRLNRIFFADATSTILGSLTGTSTVTSYIESSAGVAAGGRTGVTAIVTGILFFLSLFIAPVVGAIPITGAKEASTLTRALGFTAVVLSTINVVSGYLITDRMLKMFKKRGAEKK